MRQNKDGEIRALLGSILTILCYRGLVLLMLHYNGSEYTTCLIVFTTIAEWKHKEGEGGVTYFPKVGETSSGTGNGGHGDSVVPAVPLVPCVW